MLDHVIRCEWAPGQWVGIVGAGALGCLFLIVLGAFIRSADARKWWRDLDVLVIQFEVVSTVPDWILTICLSN